MDVHVYLVCVCMIFLIGIGPAAFTIKTIKMCKVKLCMFSDCICNAKIECEAGTDIKITEVKYRDTTIYVCWGGDTFCGTCCANDLNNIPEYTDSIMELCNSRQTCNLESTKPDKKWKMKITYACYARSTIASSKSTTTDSKSTIQTTSSKTADTTTIVTQTSHAAIKTKQSTHSSTLKRSSLTPAQQTDSGRFVNEDEESGSFPLAVTVAIPVGCIVLILAIVGIICVARRKSKGTMKSIETEENTLPIEDMTDAINEKPPSGIKEEQYEHKYIDTTFHNAMNTTDNDEYNTLNIYPAPVQMDPNYDHMPKNTHKTIAETYSHFESQTAIPDATYSHLQDSKSNASNNVKRNQNNSNNVYNHINTLSDEDNVYYNTETNFTQNLTSNLSQTRAEENDYDHTDWNQATSQKPIVSRNDAIKKSDGYFTEDEYAVVNKRSDDKVEGND